MLMIFLLKIVRGPWARSSGLAGEWLLTFPGTEREGKARPAARIEPVKWCGAEG
jgi:hypothetical protein